MQFKQVEAVLFHFPSFVCCEDTDMQSLQRTGRGVNLHVINNDNDISLTDVKNRK